MSGIGWRRRPSAALIATRSVPRSHITIVLSPDRGTPGRRAKREGAALLAAAPGGHAVKERGLSAMDLRTFAAGSDLITMVMWDLDSLDVAIKAPDGRVRHPIPLTVR